MSNSDHNYNPKLADAYSTNRKIAQKETVWTGLLFMQKPTLFHCKHLLTFALARTQKTCWSKTGIITISNNGFKNIIWKNWYLLKLWYVTCLILKPDLWDIIHIRDQSSGFSLPINYLKLILKISWDFIFLECTYKTNRYRILLFVISGIVGLNINFYIQFTFVFSKTYTDKCSILSCRQKFHI